VISDFAMLYVVHWPETNVVKVGRAYTMRRVDALKAHGAELLLLLRDTPSLWELAALAEMDATFEHAFESLQESLHHLPRGVGYTECFVVPDGQLERALKTIRRGIKRYGYQSDQVGAAEVLSGGGLPSSSVAGSDDVSGVDDVRGRLRERVVQSGVVEVGVVAVGGDGVGGVDRGSPGVVDGRGVSESVYVGLEDVLRDCGLVGVAAGGQADGVEGPETSSRVAREWLASGSRPARGRGERRGRGCVGVGESARRGRAEQLATRSRGYVSVLQEASGWYGEGVQGVWYGSFAVQQVSAGHDRSGGSCRRFGSRRRVTKFRAGVR